MNETQFEEILFFANIKANEYLKSLISKFESEEIDPNETFALLRTIQNELPSIGDAKSMDGNNVNDSNGEKSFLVTNEDGVQFKNWRSGGWLELIQDASNNIDIILNDLEEMDLDGFAAVEVIKDEISPPKEWIRQEDAIQMLKVSRQTLYNWRKKGLKVIKMGKKVYYSEEELIKFSKSL